MIESNRPLRSPQCFFYDPPAELGKVPGGQKAVFGGKMGTGNSKLFSDVFQSWRGEPEFPCGEGRADRPPIFSGPLCAETFGGVG